MTHFTKPLDHLFICIDCKVLQLKGNLTAKAQEATNFSF